MSMQLDLYCSNIAQDIPWSSAACAVTTAENNTAIMTKCCGKNNVASYGYNNSVEYPFCYRYCNMTTPKFRDSPTFACLDSAKLTGWVCRNELKGDAVSTLRKLDGGILAGMVALAGVCVMSSF
ncbi:hypothetical protein IFR05_002721 [Cadophora sp. M221]|nr:hypothetical protein IFR05_002721 [Cadophora sp. M221]